MKVWRVMIELICQQFARIIGGQEGFAGGKCVATINRDEIRATILGKRFRVTSSFSFESRDNKTGRALCLEPGSALTKRSQWICCYYY